MNRILLEMASNIVSVTFAVGAVILAYSGSDGWGWMIFASVLTITTTSLGKSDERNQIPARHDRSLR